ncbi:RNA polymerase sigma factor [Streptomyces sp. NPDC096339]|uniref:RNA polymerase sigma factor n=1 Tax=Streptomyces sp. NPDC096339 TaxID=3366086 RepID=UPI0038093352
MTEPHEEAWRFEGEMGNTLRSRAHELCKSVVRYLATKFYKTPKLKGYFEDIAQEAYMETVRSWEAGRLDPDRDPLGYMCVVARNLALKVLKVPEDPMEDERLHIYREGETWPEEEDDEIEEVLHDAISRMKRTQRRVVIGRQLRGDADSVIASAIGVSVEQVHVQRHLGVKELKTMDIVRNRIRDVSMPDQPRGEGDR